MRTLRLRDAAAGLRRPLAAALAAAALSCGEHDTSGPGIATPASIAVAPVFESAVADGPVIVLDRVAGWLVPIPRADSAYAEATFDGDAAALAFDVLVLGREQRFVFRLDAFDAEGERVFASTDTVAVRAGEESLVEGIALQYVARDAAVTDFAIEARTFALAVGDTVHLKARACCGEGEQPFPVHAGWSAREPLVATVDRLTGVVSAVAPGRAWIVATLFNGAADSTEVAVGGGVESVTIETSAVTLDAIGATAPLAAVARDAAGAPIDATIAWRSLAPGVATVEAASGVVTAASNGVAPIVAEAGSKADTLLVTVTQVAATVAVAPATVTLMSGETATLGLEARDRAGALVSQPSAVWTSGATTIATVDAAGRVSAVGTGTTTITATVDGVDGTATVDVLDLAPLARTWIGGDAAAPASWTNGANWSPAGVPAAGDTVVVPAAAYAPVLAADATIAALTVAPGASLQVDRTLTVAGSATGAITGAGTVRLAGAAGDSVAGDFPSLLVVADVRAGGDVRASGQLIVSGPGRLRPAGHTIVVGGALATTGGGMLVMSAPGDSVDVGGAADFSGGDSRGSLAAGVLVVRGDFQATGLDAFSADPGLLVVFAGKAAQRAFMELPGAYAQHFADVVVATESTEGVRFENVWISGALRDDGVRPARLTFESGASRVDGGVSLVVTGGDVAGMGTLTVAGDIDALSSTLSVGTLRLGGAKGTTMIGALGAGHAVLELFGARQPLRSGLEYRDVSVTGTATLSGPEDVIVGGSLLVEGDAAELEPAGTRLVVAGNLATGKRGVLAMRNDADDVTVKGAVTIDGGPTELALVHGILRVGGDFAVVCETAECFRPGASGTFRVMFDGVEQEQRVSLALPGAPGDGGALQHFRHVSVANPAGVTLTTGTPVLGDAYVGAKALVTIPEGVWMDVAGRLTVERSGSDPGRIDNYGELFAGEDDTGGTVKPNAVQARK